MKFKIYKKYSMGSWIRRKYASQSGCRKLTALLLVLTAPATSETHSPAAVAREISKDY